MTCGPETLPERFRALWMDADAVCAYIRRIGVNRVFSAQTFFRLAVQTDGGWLAYDHVLHGANAHDIPLSGIHIRFDDGDTFEAIVGQEPAEAQDVLQQLAVDIHSPWHPMAEIKDGLDHAFVHLASVDDVRVDSLLEDVGVPITRVMVRGAGEKDWNGVAALRFLSGQTAQDLQDRICAGGNDFLALPWNPASSETAGRIHIRTDSVMGVMVRGAYGAQDGTYIDNSVEMVVRYGHRRVLYYAYGNDFDAARMAARRFLGACPQLRCMDARKMVYLDPTRVQVAVNPQMASRVFVHFKGGAKPEALTCARVRDATELVNAINAAIKSARYPAPAGETPTGAKVIPLRPS